MIQQPGGTDLQSEQITGKFREAFSLIFEAIGEYHKALDYPPATAIDEEQILQEHARLYGPGFDSEASAATASVILDLRLSYHRDFCNALTAEVVELLDAVPWKPWRPFDYKEVDIINIVEEMMDIVFFLGSVRRTWNLTPEMLADVFERKLIENYRRINNGYSQVGGN